MKNLFYGEKHSFIELTYFVTTYGTEIKETDFEIYTKHISCPLALPLSLKLPISTKNGCHLFM